MEQKELSDLIFTELSNPEFSEQTRGRTGGEKLSMIAEPYIEYLDPYWNSDYPVSNLGTFARVVPDYLESFVNLDAIILKMDDSLKKENELRTLLNESRTDDSLYLFLRKTLKETIHKLGDESYRYEWNDPAAGTGHKKLDSTLNYADRNARIAVDLTDKIIRTFNEKGSLVIADFGSGDGATSNQLLAYMKELSKPDANGKRRIPENYLEKTKLILVDVSKAQMEQAKKNLQDEFRIENIEKVNSNFRDISENLDAGSVDIMISGVAICHVTHKEKFFRDVYEILAHGGEMSFWDPTVSKYQAHNLRKSDDGKYRTILKTPEGITFTLDRGEKLEDIADAKALRDLADKKYSSTAEIPWEECVRYAVEQVTVFLPLMGYSDEIIDEQEYKELAEKLLKDILSGVRTGEGFNYIKWMGDNLPKYDIDIKHQTAYDVLEAVEDLAKYESAIKAANFRNFKYERFKGFKNLGSATLADDLLSEIYKNRELSIDYTTTKFHAVKPLYA
ncbi:MAG: class I SAM-dependent methyltransferase [Nanoarchaeota archaeon]|nr:class I SAM-dependent methyltransferase [Nanoarchaeota archaeon]